LPNPDLGAKRVCPSCAAKFYDLTKRPIVCPKCSYAFQPEALLKSRRPRAGAAAAKDAPKAAEVVKAAVESADEELEDTEAAEEEAVEEEIEEVVIDEDVVADPIVTTTEDGDEAEVKKEDDGDPSIDGIEDDEIDDEDDDTLIEEIDDEEDDDLSDVIDKDDIDKE
jgi:uncharacterized protein (TIGR02300 family)